MLRSRSEFKEIKRKPNPKYYNTSSTTIIYPVVVTKNKAVSKLINDSIKNDFFDSDEQNQSVEKSLGDHIDNGLINLDYNINFKTKGILSITISFESCGAYCNSNYTYFNFDLKTGKLINIEDIIKDDKLDSFRKIVFRDKIANLEEYKEEQKIALSNNYIDSTTYDWALQEVNEYCISDSQINSFFLSNTNLEIIDPCEFPHAIRSQEPLYKLKYSYEFLKPYIKKEFLLKIK